MRDALRALLSKRRGNVLPRGEDFIDADPVAEPGADTGHHVHGLGYVVVPMTDCDFLIEEDGGERRVHSKTGAVYRREAGVAHNVVNGGDKPMSFIEIEYK
mgnify:CR=1 FL=1